MLGEVDARRTPLPRASTKYLRSMNAPVRASDALAAQRGEDGVTPEMLVGPASQVLS
jgi:hypothetical protein